MKNSNRQWPKRALALFGLIVVVIYALVFFTGNRQATPKLGIDLQGGTRVTLAPQGEDPTQDQLRQARNILEQRVNGMGVSGSEVVINGNTLVITVPGEDASQAQAVGQTSQLYFRPVAQPSAPDLEKLDKELEDMANRWVKYGVLDKDEANKKLEDVTNAVAQQEAQAEGKEPKDVKAPKVSAKPLDEPSNSIEQTERRDEVTEMLLEDRQSDDPTTQAAASSLLTCQGSADPLAGADDPSKPFVTCDYDSGTPYVLEPAPLLNGVEDEDGTRLTGNEIDTNSPINGGLNPQSGQMEISFSFKTGNGPNGSQTWADLTREHLNDQIAITLDSAVISAPVIQGATPYGSATSINGDFSQEEANNLANNLRYGALPLSFAGENGEPGGTVESIPPTLGKAALEAGLWAGLAGLILVILYSLYYFRALSGVSVIFLLGSGLLTYGAIVLLGRWIGYSLDLSGIAGLVIGVGATADSFVVYYERIKDELLEGRTFRSATQKAWERSRSTIVTGNAVTLIGSVIVYFLAIGEVKGFAFTLGLTTIFDLVVSFLVMAPLMQIIGRRPAAAKPSMNGLGGIYALIEERRERGYYAESRGVATASQARATDNSASASADSSESSAPSAAAEDEEK
ncbi:protein translocase subunit SecD [Corynebacterium accolens]|jgi:protein-export membrane protein, secD/secF family|uniref:Protein translocase subunit SecD n=1 Tax=Corynebacterium segmentosum TaxID=43990 RepID=A0ABY6TFE5_9CORY|nr:MULTISPECIES: protein translocase subunit SecD [Corynebacterium]EEI13980.1 export membrane protein SecD [Corynebacterium accolens ATCC 49725]MDK4233720.1 protein translocase subunit SecD [Corynebacterium accolens]MDK4330490.1 protein translocase subunit SecD [Corynebacterium accolens]MDK8674007.1 protein translocase subunit SecD [Corynebacterium accolens]UQZ28100.1 preprotein translocase subunit SecD [Corynebacterium accolens]